jgi:hypothetical protein
VYKREEQKSFTDFARQGDGFERIFFEKGSNETKIGVAISFFSQHEL